MARPKKQTVDYFPHFVNSGKTLYILEESYGNDGYTFWFKLLELLGTTDGHVYDCRNVPSWKFLLAKTRVSEDIANEILNTLAELDAIDSKLWQKRLIWSDNFVKNLLPVYNNRKSDMPKKPIIDSENNIVEEFLQVETPRKRVSTAKNPQSKVKESKVKESKVEESNNTENYHEENERVLSSPATAELMNIVNEKMNMSINAFVIDQIKLWQKNHEHEVIKEALKRSALSGAKNLNYTDAILRDWESKNIKTLEDINLKDVKPNYKGKGYEVEAPKWIKNQQQQTIEEEDDEPVDQEELKRLLEGVTKQT